MNQLVCSHPASQCGRPPSSNPTYPGGAPINLDTENFSIYSDISSLIIACSSSKRNSASARASSVLPTPVVPIKINEPIGLFASCKPVRDLLIALDTADTASFCPTTLL